MNVILQIIFSKSFNHRVTSCLETANFLKTGSPFRAEMIFIWHLMSNIKTPSSPTKFITHSHVWIFLWYFNFSESLLPLPPPSPIVQVCVHDFNLYFSFFFSRKSQPSKQIGISRGNKRQKWSLSQQWRLHTMDVAQKQTSTTILDYKFIDVDILFKSRRSLFWQKVSMSLDSTSASQKS